MKVREAKQYVSREKKRTEKVEVKWKKENCRI